MELRALYKLRDTLTYAEFIYCCGLLLYADREGKTHVTTQMMAIDTGYSKRILDGVAPGLKKRGVVQVVEAGRRGFQSVLRVTASRVLTEAHCNESKPVSLNHISLKPTSGKRVLTEVQTRNSLKPTSASSTYSSTNTSAARSRERKKPTTEHHQLIEYFSKKWSARYGGTYTFSGKDAAAIKWILLSLVQDLPMAKKLVDVYLSDNERYVRDQCHPLTLLRSNFNKYKFRSSNNGHDYHPGGATLQTEI